MNMKDLKEIEKDILGEAYISDETLNSLYVVLGVVSLVLRARRRQSNTS
jgi:hypothetical protein